jgi:hypothetical protein
MVLKSDEFADTLSLWSVPEGGTGGRFLRKLT